MSTAAPRLKLGIEVVQADELVQTAFDSLPDRICVLERDGSIVLANQTWSQAARQTGASPSRCGPGANYLEVCKTARGPFAEGALEAANGIESVLRGASPLFNLDYPCPSPSRKAWFRLIARPLSWPRSGAVIVHSEITSHVLLAEKLRRTQARYEVLLENPVHVATVMTADGHIRYQSPASEGVFGIRREELVGHSILEFVHPDDSGAVRDLLRDCLRFPRRKHPCEYRFRSGNGSWRTLESIASNLLSHPEGGIILNSRDITRQKIAEKTLLAKHDALVRNREELGALAARLFRQQEEERRRVAAQLSGAFSQRLAALSLQAAQLAFRAHGAVQSSAIRDCVTDLGRHLHDLAGGLHPAALEHFGLAVALRDYCAEFTRKEGIPVRYVHRGISTRVPGHTAATLYRIAEEAMTNIARHAQAHHAWVTLSRTAKGIRLAIHDDGDGFDPAAVDPGPGLGILAMRERLRAVRGSLFIRSRLGAGTEVVALAPLATLFAAGDQPCSPIAGNVVVNPLDQH